MTWKHIGGGCGLCCEANFQCDDEYENSETRERVTVYTTMEAHFEMPSEVDTLEELRDRAGVKQAWEENAHDSCAIDP